MSPALRALPGQTGACEEGTERAWAALLGSGSVLMLPCPIWVKQWQAHVTRWWSDVSQRALQVRKEKCVLPLCETCFHTLVASRLGQKRQKCCF